MRNKSQWLKNKNLSGEWKYDNSLPSHFKKLPDDGNWGEVKDAIPPTKSEKDEPTVFVSERPAELILIDVRNGRNSHAADRYMEGLRFCGGEGRD